ncbi:MAG TPA: transglutaminase family protein, partial [Crinalium sp.]
RGDLTGIAVTEQTIYLTTDQQLILACDRQTESITEIGTTPGKGIDDLCYFNGDLFVVDSKEQTVYCFDLKINTVIYEILTPFENPTGITAVYSTKAKQELLYVAYSRHSFEVYDTGDSEFQLQIQTHYGSDREWTVADNFIYPLVYKLDEAHKTVLSNGVLVEMYYVEKLYALPEIADAHPSVENLEWKISLPMNSDRQHLVSLEKIGGFDMAIKEIAEEEHRKVAVFSIPKLDLHSERRIFGWKATVRMFGIRHCLAQETARELTEDERSQFSRYLKNEDQLDMDRESVQQAAKDAVRHLRGSDRHNIIKKAEAIRDYIYEKITYKMDSYSDGTADVLRNGEGSCGEYLNVFLSLFRLNHIPARKCGNYKVPAYKMQAGSESVFLSPDFNHVWLQFYIPDWGWIPMESSADDQAASFRGWPRRYFMALAWYHMECRMGHYFEEVFEKDSDRPFFLSAGDLAKKDIKFKVVRVLAPATIVS